MPRYARTWRCAEVLLSPSRNQPPARSAAPSVVPWTVLSNRLDTDTGVAGSTVVGAVRYPECFPRWQSARPPRTRSGRRLCRYCPARAQVVRRSRQALHRSRNKCRGSASNAGDIGRHRRRPGNGDHKVSAIGVAVRVKVHHIRLSRTHVTQHIPLLRVDSCLLGCGMSVTHPWTDPSANGTSSMGTWSATTTRDPSRVQARPSMAVSEPGGSGWSDWSDWSG